MALVSSLLSAIVRADGDALVLHVGEKPYVVTQSGNVELSSQGLSLEAMSGMLTQLLPPDAMRSLAEFGAVEHELLPRQAMQGDRFTVVAARGGEDIWIEIRRHRVPRAIEIVPAGSEPRIDDVLAPVFARAGELASLGGAPVPVPVQSVEAAAPVMAPVPPAEPAPVARAVPTTVSTSDATPAGELPIEAKPQRDLAVEATVSRKGVDDAMPIVSEPPPVDVKPSVREAPPVSARVDLETSIGETSPASARADVDTSDGGAFPASTRTDMDSRRETSPAAARADVDASAGGTFPASAHPDMDARRETSPAAARADVDTSAAEVFVPSAHMDVNVRAGDTSTAAARVDAESTVFETPPAFARVDVDAKDGEASPAVARIDMGASDGATPPVSARVEATPPVSARVEATPPVSARVELDTIEDETPPAQTRREVEASSGGPVLVPMTRAVRVDQTIRSAPARPGGVERLLALAVSRGASVLCLTSQSRPFVRADGEIHVLEGEAPLAAADVEGAVLELTPEGSREALRRGEPTEWVSEFEGIGRIRCTTFRDYRGPGAFFHLISARPISAEQLGLARGIQALATESDGLVVVAAPRGGGKSTLVAAFVDLINRQQAGYVVTLEKQIRIVHENRHSLISQREVRGTAAEVVSAARAALRENPDVMVLEDAGSAEVIQLALDAAGSGLLVFVSVTAPSTIGAIVRMLDWFPPERRPSVQAALAERLRGAVSQVMLRKAGGGRVAARELLLTTTAVASVLHEGQVGQLSVAMDSGRKHGMVPLNDALLALVQTGVVDVREAYRKADNQDALLKLLKREGVDTSFVERLA